MISRKELFRYYDEFKDVFNLITEKSNPNCIENLCNDRGYNIDEMYPVLKEVGLAFIDEDNDDAIREIRKFSRNLGLYGRESVYIAGRYIIPIRDLMGNIIAMVGWYDDYKRYITTPSMLFSKRLCFFGMENINRRDEIILVEGIFDAISVRTMGYRCLATMGIDVSREKAELLRSVARRVVSIPDNDSQGRRVVINDKWKVGNNTYLQWSGKYSIDEIDYNIKDIDLMLKIYEKSSVKEMIDDTLQQRHRKVVKYNI